MKFFSVGDNSFSTNGYPWINNIVSGLPLGELCPECNGRQYPPGNIEVTLERRKGTKWPDVIGCGAMGLFIVSERVLEVWTAERIGEFPHHHVKITGMLPNKLMGKQPPKYFWIHGSKLEGALLDYEASGYRGIRQCSKCRRVS